MAAVGSVARAALEEVVVVVISVVDGAGGDEPSEKLELVGRMAGDSDDVPVAEMREEIDSNKDELGVVAAGAVGVAVAVWLGDEDGRVGATVVTGATAGVVVAVPATAAADVEGCRVVDCGFCAIGGGGGVVAGPASVGACADVAVVDCEVLSPPPCPCPLPPPPAALLAGEPPPSALLLAGGGGGLPPNPTIPRRDPRPNPFEGAVSCGAAMVLHPTPTLTKHTPYNKGNKTNKVKTGQLDSRHGLKRSEGLLVFRH